MGWSSPPLPAADEHVADPEAAGVGPEQRRAPNRKGTSPSLVAPLPTRAGQELFCTEAQARAAGYRRAIVRQK